MEPEPPDASMYRVLHKLWTKAVGTKGYINPDWQRMAAFVEKHEEDPA